MGVRGKLPGREKSPRRCGRGRHENFQTDCGVPVTPTASLYCGDALEVLGGLPAGSVRCCVTSPPYWGLRDYGVAGQIGLEPTPEAYVAKMVAVFREVRQVLATDGTLWLNVGDSYAAGGKGGGGSYMAERRDAAWQKRSTLNGWRAAPDGMKAKDLCGIPWMLAFALRADGWWLRSDIIWSKPNPMPESVTDRPTKSHEYVFLLSKAAQYYYDAVAIAEDCVRGDAGSRFDVGKTGTNGNGRVQPQERRTKQRKPAGWDTGAGAHGTVHRDGRALEVEYTETVSTTRNSRTVWTIPTQAYPQAHFATFPEELARRCILAGSRPGDTVLDPFGGSGTVAQVATGNGRSSIYIDLNPKYMELAKQRIGPLLCEEMTLGAAGRPGGPVT